AFARHPIALASAWFPARRPPRSAAAAEIVSHRSVQAGCFGSAFLQPAAAFHCRLQVASPRVGRLARALPPHQTYPFLRLAFLPADPADPCLLRFGFAALRFSSGHRSLPEQQGRQPHWESMKVHPPGQLAVQGRFFLRTYGLTRALRHASLIRPARRTESPLWLDQNPALAGFPFQTSRPARTRHEAEPLNPSETSPLFDSFSTGKPAGRWQRSKTPRLRAPTAAAQAACRKPSARPPGLDCPPHSMPVPTRRLLPPGSPVPRELQPPDGIARRPQGALRIWRVLAHPKPVRRTRSRDRG